MPDIVKNGNSFTLTFSGVKGYFVLDYDRENYSLTGVKISVGGEERDFGGMEFLSENTDIAVTFTVDTAESLTECPIAGKVYRTA